MIDADEFRGCVLRRRCNHHCVLGRLAIRKSLAIADGRFGATIDELLIGSILTVVGTSTIYEILLLRPTASRRLERP